MRSLERRLNWVSRKIRLFVSDGRCTLVMFFFFLLDVSIRMQVKFQSRSDWIFNCCLDIRVASQSCLYKCNYFRYFSYCFLVLIKLFEEVLKLSWLLLTNSRIIVEFTLGMRKKKYFSCLLLLKNKYFFLKLNFVLFRYSLLYILVLKGMFLLMEDGLIFFFIFP